MWLVTKAVNLKFVHITIVFILILLTLPSVTLADQYSYVYGKVVNEYGSSLSNVQVQFYTLNGALAASTNTSSDGSFSLWLTYGTYSLQFTKTGYAKTMQSVLVQWLDTDLGVITLNKALKLSSSSLGLAAEPSSVLNIQFSVGNLGTIPETVSFLVDAPADWSSKVLDGSKEVVGVYLSTGQSMSLQLELTVSPNAQAYVGYNVSLTAFGSSNSTLTFNIYVKPKATVLVTGRVLDENGARLENVSVCTYSSDGLPLEVTYTDFNGDFKVMLPASTAVTLNLMKEGYVKSSKNLQLKNANISVGDITLSKTIKLYSSTLNVTSNPGNKILMPFTISNLGDEAEPVSFKVEGAEDWGAKILLPQSNMEVSKVYLSPGSSLSLQLDLTIPPSFTGERRVSITASYRETSSLEFYVQVKQTDTNIVLCSFPGKSASAGDTVRFQVKLNNPTNILQRFTVSVNHVPQGWITSVKNAAGESVVDTVLDGNSYAELTVQVIIPSDTEAGNYTLMFSASSLYSFGDIPLLVAVTKSTSSLSFEASPPYFDTYAGSQARFTLNVSNLGGSSELFNLSIQGLPSDFKGWFESSAKQRITKIYVEPGKTSQIYLVVETPSSIKLGARNFTVSVGDGYINKTLPLTLNILGSYQLQITNQNFYTSLNVGGQGTFTLSIKNIGSQEVTNVKVVLGTVPNGFTATISPTQISSIGVDQDVAFTITIQSQSDVNAGNYYVDLMVISNETQTQTYTLRVEVLQETGWLMYSGIFLIAALAALIYIYKRFGRR